MNMLIYPKDIDINKEELLEDVKSETINKVYNPAEYSLDKEEILRTEFSLVDDEKFWFNRYLKDACYNVSVKISALNRSNYPTYEIDSEQALFLVTVVDGYDVRPIEDLIKSYLTYYIVYKWYVMKNLMKLADVYKDMYVEPINSLRSIAVRGVEGKYASVVGGGAIQYRVYDIGFRGLAPRSVSRQKHECECADKNYITADNIKHGKGIAVKKIGKNVEISATISDDLEKHDKNPDAHPDIRKSLKTLGEVVKEDSEKIKNIKETLDKAPEIYEPKDKTLQEQKHKHDNKGVLDKITDELISGWATNGQVYYFAHEDRGRGSGSDWANAKGFTNEAYNAVPVNTACLFLGDGTKKYALMDALTITADKPVFGGFVGNGLLREKSVEIKQDPTWSNVIFSQYATVFEGGLFTGIYVDTFAFLSNVIVGNCSSTSSFGNSGINNRGTVDNCTVSNCSQKIYGAGCGFTNAGTLTNCMAAHCRAPHYGGGFTNGGTMISCTAINCSAGYNGGGFHGNGTLTNCTAIDCSAGESGGGFINAGTLTNCVAINCIANIGGGGFDNLSGGIISNSTALNCSSRAGGSGGFLNKGTISNSTAKNCIASGSGGGFYNLRYCTLANCTAINCRSGIFGGGFLNEGTISNCTAINCYAPEFPAFYPSGQTGITSINCTTILGDLQKVAYTRDYKDLINTPTSLPAKGGNADTLGGKSRENIEVNSIGYTPSTRSLELTKGDNSKLSTILPQASADADGLMTKSDFSTIVELKSNVDSLKSGGVWRGTFGTYADMIAAFPNMDVSGTNWFENDFVFVLADENRDAFIKPETSYILTVTGDTKKLEFRKLESVPVATATNDSLGTVKGDPETEGKIFVETDGTMSVLGWDKTQTKIGQKIEKVKDAKEGNFASLDASGNLMDSEKSASDFEPKDEELQKQKHTHANKTALDKITDTLIDAWNKLVSFPGFGSILNMESGKAVQANDPLLSDVTTLDYVSNLDFRPLGGNLYIWVCGTIAINMDFLFRMREGQHITLLQYSDGFSSGISFDISSGCIFAPKSTYESLADNKFREISIVKSWDCLVCLVSEEILMYE